MVANAARSFHPAASNVQSHSAANEYQKVLQESTIGKNIKDCEYAVRGAIPLLGAQIEERIKDGDVSFPFKKIIPLNIGNPQAVG